MPSMIGEDDQAEFLFRDHRHLGPHTVDRATMLDDLAASVIVQKPTEPVIQEMSFRIKQRIRRLERASPFATCASPSLHQS